MRSFQDIMDAYEQASWEAQEFWDQNLAPRVAKCRNKADLRAVQTWAWRVAAGSGGRMRDLPANISNYFLIHLALLPD